MTPTAWYYDFTCPSCGLAGHIDQQQQAGVSSVLCPQCGFYGWNQAPAIEVKCDGCQHQAWRRNDELGKHSPYCAATGRSQLKDMDYADCLYFATRVRVWKDKAERSKEPPWKL